VFGFEQWDSPLALGVEAGVSLIIFIGILYIVRRVNVNAEAERQRYMDAKKSASADLDREQNDQDNRLNSK
jgi:hypothetical protein